MDACRFRGVGENLQLSFNCKFGEGLPRGSLRGREGSVPLFWIARLSRVKGSLTRWRNGFLGVRPTAIFANGAFPPPL